jgi:hypothetical protein
MFCDKYMPIWLLDNPEYQKGNYARALEEVFVELDYMLINDEGHEKMRNIVLDMKKAVRGPASKLDPAEEKEIKGLAF